MTSAWRCVNVGNTVCLACSKKAVQPSPLNNKQVSSCLIKCDGFRSNIAVVNCKIQYLLKHPED